MPDPGRVAIIGSGPTGLGAAWRLKELGHEDVVIYEASDFIGGLASSHVDARGFTWDVGGHVQFSHYKYFDELMELLLDKDGWLFHERESWVWMRGTFIPYPFQYNIRRLPQADLDACLRGLVAISQGPAPRKPANFREWVLATFGRGIADAFMVPYNFKVWAYPLEELAYGWVGERVAVTDLSRVQENIRLGKDDVSWGPNNTFRFPRFGGTGAVWRALAARVGAEKIKLRTTVRSVRAKDKTLVLSDGSEARYDTLLNTGPLDRFTQLVDDLPAELKEAARGLVHSSTNIVGIGLAGKPREELSKKCWMYFPEGDCPFYRVTVFSNYSPNNVPDISRCWSLMAETSESPKKPVRQETLVEDTIQGLLNTRLIASRDEIVSTWSYRAPHGYPTPSVGRDAILDRLIPELDARGLFSRGRFGAWKYEVSNQDHSLMQGAEWANRVVQGAPEMTCFRPALANSNFAKRERFPAFGADVPR